MNWFDRAVPVESRINVLRSFAAITLQDWQDFDWIDVVYVLYVVHEYLRTGRDSMIANGLGPNESMDEALRLNGFEVLK